MVGFQHWHSWGFDSQGMWCFLWKTLLHRVREFWPLNLSTLFYLEKLGFDWPVTQRLIREERNPKLLVAQIAKTLPFFLWNLQCHLCGHSTCDHLLFWGVSFRNQCQWLSAARELSASAQWVIRYILPYNLPWSHWRRVEVQFYPFFNLSTRWGLVVNATLQLFYPWEWPDMPYIGGWVFNLSTRWGLVVNAMLQLFYPWEWPDMPYIGGWVFNLSTRWGLAVNATLQLFYPWEWPDMPYIGGWVFNLSTRWGLVVNATLQLFYPWEWPNTPYIGGWVGPRASLDGCRKLPPPHRDLITVSSSYTLSWPMHSGSCSAIFLLCGMEFLMEGSSRIVFFWTWHCGLVNEYQWSKGICALMMDVASLSKTLVYIYQTRLYHQSFFYYQLKHKRIVLKGSIDIYIKNAPMCFSVITIIREHNVCSHTARLTTMMYFNQMY